MCYNAFPGISVHLLSTKWVDYVEEPMKYQALRPQFFSVGGCGVVGLVVMRWVGVVGWVVMGRGGRMGGGRVGVVGWVGVGGGEVGRSGGGRVGGGGVGVVGVGWVGLGWWGGGG